MYSCGRAFRHATRARRRARCLASTPRGLRWWRQDGERSWRPGARPGLGWRECRRGTRHHILTAAGPAGRRDLSLPERLRRRYAALVSCIERARPAAAAAAACRGCGATPGTKCVRTDRRDPAGNQHGTTGRVGQPRHDFECSRVRRGLPQGHLPPRLPFPRNAAAAARGTCTAPHLQRRTA